MSDSSILMTAALQRSPLDARRGVVRLHPEVLELLHVRPWEPLSIEGTRATAALGAQAAPTTDRWSILMDDITCANAGVQPGDKVKVGRARVSPAAEVVIAGDGHSAVDPFALRFSLLGKVVRAGDKVSMLPQDFTRPESGVDLETLVRYLNANLGAAWKAAVLDVSNTVPEGLVRMTMETVVLWSGDSPESAVRTSSSAAPLERTDGIAPTFDDLPGHEDALKRLRELFDLGFHHRDLLNKLGSSPGMGVLISGPPGSGKVAVVRAVAAAVGARIVHRWGPAVARLAPDVGAKSLREAFAEARSGAPAILLVEDVDAIAPREEAGPLLSVLLEETRALIAAGNAAVVCTTAHPEATSPELRRPRILDAETEISLPNVEQRRRILEVSTRRLPLAVDVALEDVAARTPGFVAADLIALCRESSLRAAQRALGGEQVPEVAQVDFDAALEVTKPSSMEGLSVQVGDVHLSDVGDMEATKKELEEAIVWPLRYPDTFERLGVAPSRGVLLYGPPGCGKTFLVRALANDAGANFMSVKGAELLSKWVGESERGVRELFRRARAAAPTVLFFDEIDALAPERGSSGDQGTTDRVVAQLLTELDGVEELRNVFVLGATNRPDLIDPALMRPGRLERLVYVPPPDAVARAAILSAVTKRMPVAPEVDLAAVAASCDGYSAADLEGLVRQAALAAMRSNMEAPVVTAAHFEEARSTVTPSLDSAQVEKLERFAASR